MREVLNTLLDILVYPFIWRPIRNYSSRISSSSPEADPLNVEQADPLDFQPQEKEPPEFDHTDWAPVTLTLVEYPKDDWLGFVYACVSLAPLILIVALITLILFRRDLWTVSWSWNAFKRQSNAFLNR